MENTAADSAKDYDEYPYDSLPFPQSHPDRLATMATLFGMQPARVEKCRVLEIGCASGGNLIPMAFNLPESEFLGIDLSRVQIEDGQQTIAALGLSNVKLTHLNLKDVDESFGEFDYIIAHGVYSWVPTDIQDALLNICRKHLANEGVAYISYNVYPGWHFRGLIREMMLYHTASISEPGSKIWQAKELLNFLVNSISAEQKVYGLVLKDEMDLLSKESDAYLLHEHLASNNSPVYFHRFVEALSEHDLQFLSESHLFQMIPQNCFSQAVCEAISKFTSSDLVKTEQYKDFLQNKLFRQSLICRKEVRPERLINAEHINSFFVSSPARLLVESGEEKRFEMYSIQQYKSSYTSGFAIPWRDLAAINSNR